MNINKSNIRFGIIGCGRLGTSLAVFLSQQGFVPTAFASRSLESAQKTCDFAGQGKVYASASEAASKCSVVFITTPDTVIESICSMIAQEKGFSSGSIVYHLSGAQSSGILAKARSPQVSIGSIHPLQSFAPYKPGQKSPFKGINISIEGDPEAVTLGKEIVNALKANSFTIPTDAKTLYHASAVVASNYLVTLEHFALELLKTADISEADAFEILEPLILGTLRNIRARGSVNALTGPVARGDDEIVASHLADIDKKLPHFSELYRMMGKYTLDIAVQRGQISKQAQEKLSGCFKS